MQSVTRWFQVTGWEFAKSTATQKQQPVSVMATRGKPRRATEVTSGKVHPRNAAGSARPNKQQDPRPRNRSLRQEETSAILRDTNRLETRQRTSTTTEGQGHSKDRRFSSRIRKSPKPKNDARKIQTQDNPSASIYDKVIKPERCIEINLSGARHQRAKPAR